MDSNDQKTCDYCDEWGEHNRCRRSGKVLGKKGTDKACYYWIKIGTKKANEDLQPKFDRVTDGPYPGAAYNGLGGCDNVGWRRGMNHY